MPILSHYPFATSTSSAYLVADLKNRIVRGDHNAFIAALENAKAADISLLMYVLRKGPYHIAIHILEIGADHKVTDTAIAIPARQICPGRTIGIDALIFVYSGKTRGVAQIGINDA